MGRRLLRLLVLAGVLGGCAAPAAAPSAVLLTAPVAVSVAPIRAYGQGGQGTVDPLREVATVRLTATGPGIATPIRSAQVSAAGALPALKVPIGNNRLIVAEGFNQQGWRVSRRSAVVSLATQAEVQLRLDPLTTAIGRFFEAASVPATDAGTLGKVRALVDAVVGWDAATGTFAGGVDPDHFRAAALAEAWTASPTVLELTGTPPAPPSGYFRSAGADVSVTFVDGGGQPVETELAMLFDPARTVGAAGTAGVRTFAFVPPGTWTLYAVLAGGAVYTDEVEVPERLAVVAETRDVTAASTAVAQEDL